VQNVLISIVITVKNEEKGMKHLLDSLLVQEKPFEVIVVDANSTDKTPEIVQDFASKHPEIKFVSHDNTRGESRNFGVKNASGEFIAFTDGSCVADPNWLKEMRRSITQGYDIVAGKTNKIGMSGFSNVNRVSVLHKGGDASFPTCNIVYRRDLFEKIGGFDSWFKEAEDVDMNYRALDSGARMIYNGSMIIRHTGAETPTGFIKKSFWYGFGRKELGIRHGSLWSNYNVFDMLKKQEDESWWKYVRLGIAFVGYMVAYFVGGDSEKKEKLRNTKLHQH